MVLEDEKRRLEPSESEPVAAYCRRTVQLQSDLANANREVADVSTVETVLEGLERERPEWTVLLQGLKKPEAYASCALACTERHQTPTPPSAATNTETSIVFSANFFPRHQLPITYPQSFLF
jgi:hypothetical protein